MSCMPPGGDADEARDARLHELGDVLFAVVNLARWLKLDPRRRCARPTGAGSAATSGSRPWRRRAAWCWPTCRPRPRTSSGTR